MNESIPSRAQPPHAAQNPRIWFPLRGSRDAATTSFFGEAASTIPAHLVTRDSAVSPVRHDTSYFAVSRPSIPSLNLRLCTLQHTNGLIQEQTKTSFPRLSRELLQVMNKYRDLFVR